MIPKLLLATRNAAKISEYTSLLSGAPFELTSLAEQGMDVEVRETGLTLEENAEIKALGCAVDGRFLTMADDSGLEVDALGGEPGPLSARYAGEGATDKQRIDFLLSRLKGIPWEKRGARFRCVIAVAKPSNLLGLCQGECRGVIAFEPSGGHGFGYDPVFYLPELGKTMAELTMEEKNRLSHRGLAARQALRLLEKYTSGG